MIARLVLVWVMLAAVGCQRRVELTTADFIAGLSDLQALALTPDPSYRTYQFSSYDRQSVAPDQPGWFSNSDGFGGEKIPNFLATLEPPNAEGVGKYLVAQVDGPGAIVRTWSAARSMQGRLEVFLDGAATPIYDGPALPFLRHARETLLQTTDTAKAAGGISQVDASYLPIPFAKSLRITWTGKVNELHFYHIQVRQYVPGTRIRSFTPQDAALATGLPEKIALLRDQAAEGVPLETNVAGGETQQLAEISMQQPGAIDSLTLRVRSGDVARVLNDCVLRITFDDQREASVVAPLGAFFGSAPGLVPCETLPLRVSADGTLTCRFVMPFLKRARITLENRGQEPANLVGSIRCRPIEADQERILYFHARYHQDRDITARAIQDACDVPILKAKGEGALVGTIFFLHNPTPPGQPSWWGEGDEKIWIDGGAFPAFFGTGSEDFFNYSWSDPTLFQHAFCAQPLCTGPATAGEVINQRFMVGDAIQFKQAIDFQMELGATVDTPGFDFGRIVYFYGRPGLQVDFPVKR